MQNKIGNQEETDLQMGIHGQIRLENSDKTRGSNRLNYRFDPGSGSAKYFLSVQFLFNVL